MLPNKALKSIKRDISLFVSRQNLTIEEITKDTISLLDLIHFSGLRGYTGHILK